MAERFFSVTEVEALIPRLTELMATVKAAHAEAERARAWLAAEQRRVERAGGAVLAREAWQARAGEAERALARVREALEAVARLGGEPKDLALGLVDFPHLREGRQVNLCWKHGEERVGFWHGLDEGFAARKPL